MNRHALVILLIVLAPSFITKKGYSGTKKEKEFLTVSGKIVSEHGMTLKGYNINLYIQNELIETHVAEGSFRLALQENTQYTVEIIKEGHHPKRIVIDTRIAREKDENENYKLIIEAIIYKKTQSAGSYYYDFPAALIRYDSRAFTFNINKRYIEHIREKIMSEQQSVQGGTAQ